jgi:phosphomannomutase
LKRLSSEGGALEIASLFSRDLGFGSVQRSDTTDGLRLYFDNGDIAHIRPSGNAPQLRIYAVASTDARANEIVRHAVAEPDGILRKLARGSGIS